MREAALGKLDESRVTTSSIYSTTYRELAKPILLLEFGGECFTKHGAGIFLYLPNDEKTLKEIQRFISQNEI